METLSDKTYSKNGKAKLQFRNREWADVVDVKEFIRNVIEYIESKWETDPEEIKKLAGDKLI